MAISYPLTLPSSPNFSGARFGFQANVTVFKSPLSGIEQVLERPGGMWAVTYSLPPIKTASEIGEWTAFFSSLRGMAGTFEGFDPVRTTPRGTVSSCVVNGASQTGATLAVTMTGTLLKGDYIELDNTLRYHQVVVDLSGSGNLEIEPALRESPSTGSNITFTNPKCQMRLTGNRIGWDQSDAQIYGFSFSAVEAL